VSEEKSVVYVRLERDEAQHNWSYIRTTKKREAPHLSFSE